MSNQLPPHVKQVKSRSGKPYYYVRPHGSRTAKGQWLRLPDISDPTFQSEYHRLRNEPPPPEPQDTVTKLIEAWQASSQWNAMKPSTKREWSRHCVRIGDAWGSLQVTGIEPKHVLALQESRADKVADANNMLRCLKSMMSWSVPRGWRTDNPAREVKLLKGSVPYEPWPWDVIEFTRDTVPEHIWPLIALLLYTGQRLTDACHLTPQQVRGGLIHLDQGKTGKRLLIPIHSELQALFDEIDMTGPAIALNSRGQPWKADSFQTAWNDYRPEPVAKRGLVLHGLRKSSVVTLLEAGCTDAEVGAVTGQSRRMVEHYSRQVNQLKLARSAMQRWETRWETLSDDDPKSQLMH